MSDSSPKQAIAKIIKEKGPMHEDAIVQLATKVVVKKTKKDSTKVQKQIQKNIQKKKYFTISKDKLVSIAVNKEKKSKNKAQNMTKQQFGDFCEKNMVDISGNGAEKFTAVDAFESTGFSDAVLSATKRFSTPTPIQAVCWPIISSNRDVVGVAETGSGKTLAFFLPALAAEQARPSKSKGLRILILEPTRELAMQTEEVCSQAGSTCGITSVCLYGGVPKPPQIKALAAGAAVAVATPGRLLDLSNEGSASLSGISYLVLDEVSKKFSSLR